MDSIADIQLNIELAKSIQKAPPGPKPARFGADVNWSDVHHRWVKDSNAGTKPKPKNDRGGAVRLRPVQSASSRGFNPVAQRSRRQIKPMMNKPAEIGSVQGIQGYKNWEYDLVKVSNQLGETPGGIYRDRTNGFIYYIKWPGELHARIEALAAALYERAGVRVPPMSTIMFRREVAVRSTWLPNAQLMTLGEMREEPELREGFVVDAWLANWNVIGTNGDNIVKSNGKAYRVDMGETMLFRSSGKPKKFDDEVNELQRMRDSSLTYESSQVFGMVSEADMRVGAQGVVGISERGIDMLARLAGLPEGPSDEYPGVENILDFVVTKLMERRQLISRMYGVRGSGTL